jgi:proteasome lid subunit RPN8/RPN11
VLTIDQATHDAIVAHARRDHPDEACGVVAGPAGSGRGQRFIPMLNAARSPTFYEFDSADLIRLYREMDDRDEEPVVIYHSHTATEAYPSRTDVQLAAEPGAHYVLVSTRDPAEVEFRSFRIIDGTVTEEPVRIAAPADGAEPAAPAAAGAPANLAGPATGGAPAAAGAPADLAGPVAAGAPATPAAAGTAAGPADQAAAGDAAAGWAEADRRHVLGHTPTSVVYDCPAP